MTPAAAASAPASGAGRNFTSGQGIARIAGGGGRRSLTVTAGDRQRQAAIAPADRTAWVAARSKPLRDPHRIYIVPILRFDVSRRTFRTMARHARTPTGHP